MPEIASDLIRMAAFRQGEDVNMSGVINPEFREVVHRKLDVLIERFYQDVPYGRYQRETRDLDMAYYKRHSNETILRIRLKRTVDALVVHFFTKRDPRAAKAWAQYTDEEMLHDKLFAKDLERLGVSEQEIYAQEPFFATKLLQGYFYYCLEHEGALGPLGPLASAYFVEYTTRKTQPEWLNNLEKILGEDGVRGARTHVNYDIGEDHTYFVWNVMMSLAKDEAGRQRVLQHLDNIYGLFCAYFIELHNSTVGKSAHAASVSAPAEAVTHAGRA